MMQILSKEYLPSVIVNCINHVSVYTKMRSKALPLEDISLLKKPSDNYVCLFVFNGRR